MQPDRVGHWTGTLAYLIDCGLPFASFVDLGCAEGYHSIALWHEGLIRGKTVVNVDANRLFEPSLAKIQAAIGGHYRICAVADRSGTVDMYSSAHPYWASAAERASGYWGTVNQQLGDKTVVPCRTLDSLLEEVAAPSPYLLKLDLQGFEAPALAGARRTLQQTAAIVCEMLVPAFGDTHAELRGAGFELFDVTNLSRAEDGRLGWFDAVYLNRAHTSLCPTGIWSAERNDAVTREQLERQQKVAGWIDAILGLERARRS